MTFWTELIKNGFRHSSFVFGDEAIYSPMDGGTPFSVKGIFTKKPIELGEDGRDILVSSVKTTFETIVADLKLPPQSGDLIQIRNVKYRVIEVQEDSSGSTAKLVLMKAGEENASS